jgi:hypothetical protein
MYTTFLIGIVINRCKRGDLLPATHGVSSLQFLLWPDEGSFMSRNQLRIKRVLERLDGSDCVIKINTYMRSSEV